MLFLLPFTGLLEFFHRVCKRSANPGLEVLLSLKCAVRPAQCPVQCLPLSQHNWLMVNGIDYLH